MEGRIPKSKETKKEVKAMIRLAERLKERRRQILVQLRIEKERYRSTRKKARLVRKAQGILQTLAQTVQQQAHDRITDVVTKCLEAVFEGRYRFRILFERKRGKTDARLIFEENGNVIVPKEAGSGGVIDVAAFALRLACLLWTRPLKRRVQIPDEPFRFMNPDTLPVIEELILRLAKELDVQFILVTQTPLRIGKVISL